jgi:hypothetical protein
MKGFHCGLREQWLKKGGRLKVNEPSNVTNTERQTPEILADML